jgi:hypothetical protein
MTNRSIFAFNFALLIFIVTVIGSTVATSVA